jgi:hypothetical protein
MCRVFTVAVVVPPTCARVVRLSPAIYQVFPTLLPSTLPSGAVIRLLSPPHVNRPPYAPSPAKQPGNMSDIPHNAAARLSELDGSLDTKRLSTVVNCTVLRNT